MNECPKCNAAFDGVHAALMGGDFQCWMCGTFTDSAGATYVGDECYERQLLAMQQKFAQLEARLRTALAFAESVIKSGEPWTESCEQIFREKL